MPERLTDAALAEMLAYCEAATEGPWVKRTAPHPSQSLSKADWMASNLRGNTNALYVVIPEADDEGVGKYRVVAITGDGSDSPANATFSARARTDLPAVIRELQAERDWGGQGALWGELVDHFHLDEEAVDCAGDVVAWIVANVPGDTLDYPCGTCAELQAERERGRLRDAVVEAACVDSCGPGASYEPGHCLLEQCGIARALAALKAGEEE
jgi:hypothetical protein